MPAGTASLEVRLDHRVGNPRKSLISGGRLPLPDDGYTDFGISGTVDWVQRTYNIAAAELANPLISGPTAGLLPASTNRQNQSPRPRQHSPRHQPPPPDQSRSRRAVRLRSTIQPGEAADMSGVAFLHERVEFPRFRRSRHCRGGLRFAA